MADRPRNAAQRGENERMGRDFVRNERAVADDRGDRRFRERAAEVLEHALPAPHAGEPVVPQTNAAARGRRAERAESRASGSVHLAYSAGLT